MDFLKKIFSPTILIISFLLLIYTFYKSEIYWKGNIRDYFLTYYLILLILIFFSVLTFFINQKIKEYLIIVIISLIVSLYLFEGYLTLVEQFSKEQLYEKQTTNKWDRRTSFKIYKDLKKTNNEIVIKVVPESYIFKKYSIFPLSGISNSKTINCNENGYYSTYESDRYGFNNPNTEWDKKEIEYLLVGDSYVHGDCVNRPNDISSVLRSISNKSVLNLGQGGNGSLIEYATLREYLSSNVKKVIWVYYEGNDLQNLVDEKKNDILDNYLNDLKFTQNLKFKQNEIDNLAINLIKEREREREREKDKIFFNKFIKFIKFTNTRQSIFPQQAITTPVTPLTDFKRIIQLTKKFVERNNSELFFVYLTGYDRYKLNFHNTDYSLIKNIVTELDIPFIDIHNEVFKKEQNPLKLFPFKMRGHYNIEGYKKVTETIYKLTKD
tara:strand:+ start:610 stop:1923 length:1314 start_codon:yes stop_codon:yes gene_type:complete